MNAKNHRGFWEKRIFTKFRPVCCLLYQQIELSGKNLGRLNNYSLSYYKGPYIFVELKYVNENNNGFCFRLSLPAKCGILSLASYATDEL